MTITSACLSIDFVKRLIQDHLNTNVLRCPHTITDLDLVAETDTVVVTLEPLITRRTALGNPLLVVQAGFLFFKNFIWRYYSK